MKARMSLHPGLNTRMLVGSIVVDNQMQVHFWRSFRIDRFKEPDELLMPMSWHAIPYNSSIKHHHRSKKSCRAIPFVVMRHSAATPLFQRQSWLSSIQSLNLRFLVNAQHERFVRGVEIQADNIVKLLNKLLIAAQLEGLSQMRFKLMPPPDPANRSFTHSLGFSHQSSTPVSSVLRLAMQRRLYDSSDLSIGNLGKPTRAGSILFESRHTECQKPLSPKLHRRARKPKNARYFLTLHSVSSHLDYLCALDNACRLGSATSPSIQGLCLGWRKYDGSCASGHERYHTPF